jgi:hypothetical protein
MSSPNPVGFELIAYENENQSKVIFSLFFFRFYFGFSIFDFPFDIIITQSLPGRFRCWKQERR